MIPERVDVAVLGGGFAGLACAAVLAREGCAVRVFARLQAPPSIGEYLPPEGIGALSALGLSGLLDAPEHRRAAGVLSAWGDAPHARQDVLRMPGGQAWCLDRAALERDLTRSLRDAGVEVLPVRRTPAVAGSANDWRLILDGGRQIRAGYLVDATGRAATLAQGLGAAVRRQGDLTGLALACSGAAAAGNAMLRVEGLPSGWAYAAPLSQERLVAVYLTDATSLPRRMSERRVFAEAALRAAPLIGPLLPDDLLRAAFRIAPAWSQRTTPCLGPGWAAIGDAAMAFDPLASAGLSKALLDIRELRRQLATPQDVAALGLRRAARYDGYLRALDSHYAAETRFADAAFWSARRAGLRQRARACPESGWP